MKKPPIDPPCKLNGRSLTPFTFHKSAAIKGGKWTIMYVLDFAYVSTIFRLDVRTFLVVLYFLSF